MNPFIPLSGHIVEPTSKNKLRRLSNLSILALIGLLALNPRSQAQDDLTGSDLYNQACAQCHGAALQGGLAQSLSDALWQFGSSRSAIFRNIKYGISDFSMPAFEQALSDAQINRVIDYIMASEKASGAVRPPIPSSVHTLDYEVKVETVAEGLDLPWAMDFLDASTALITERSGQLRLWAGGKLDSQPIKGLPEVLAEGQGGLLDVSIHHSSTEEPWIYLSYSHAHQPAGQDKPLAMTRIIRGHLKGHQWTDQSIIYQAPEELYLGTRHHYGSRIVFDHKGHVLFSIGDRGLAEQAQDLSRPNGKVHRLKLDGSLPEDNPFVGVKGALPSLFTLGNRNPQGLAVSPITGALWAAEHGPMGGDELNVIRGGLNYGWPAITYGRNYDGASVSDFQRREGMQQPALYWKPSIAVCGIDFVHQSAFERWNGKLLVAALKYEEVRLLDLESDRVMHQEIILKQVGRVRDVCSGPDGAVYIVTNGPDAILRLSPIRDNNAAAE